LAQARECLGFLGFPATMGCNSSSARESKAEQAEPGFATENFQCPLKSHPTLLQRTSILMKPSSTLLQKRGVFGVPAEYHHLDSNRRKPILAVPVKVVAPLDELEDIGYRAYNSMPGSPTNPFRGQQALFNVLDEFDKPPNLAATKAWIQRLEVFMWHVTVSPEQLTSQVDDLREAMDFSRSQKEHQAPLQVLL